MDLSPVWISAKTASVSIVITFFLGTAAAFFIFRMRHERLKILWDAILTLPLVLPTTVAGFSFSIFSVSEGRWAPFSWSISG